MAYYTYAVCEKCASIVRTSKVTGSDPDTVEGKTYVRISSQYCGCTSKKKKLDVVRTI